MAAVTVGFVLRLSTAAEGYPVTGFIKASVCGFNRNTAANPDGAFTAFLFIVNQNQRWFEFLLKRFACLLIPQHQPPRGVDKEVAGM